MEIRDIAIYKRTINTVFRSDVTVTPSVLEP